MNFNSITNLINWVPTFLSTLMGALVGSWSAYQLNNQKEKRKEGQENLNNLNALTTLLIKEHECLMRIKMQGIIPKADKIKEIKKTKHNNFEELLYTINYSFSFEFDLNKIIFINEKQPTLLLLIIEFKKQINILNTFISQHDNFINQKYTEDSKDPDNEVIIFPKEIGRLMSIIDGLEEIINQCLFFSNKAILLLNDYGKQYFPQKARVSYMLPEEYKYLIPPDDYVRGWDFKIEKKTFWSEYLPTLNNGLSWFSSITKKAKNWIKDSLKTNVLIKK